jgi:hypothetical protein
MPVGGVSDLVGTVLGFCSLIAADFPALFAEFGGKRFALLANGAGLRFHSDTDP